MADASELFDLYEAKGHAPAIFGLTLDQSAAMMKLDPSEFVWAMTNKGRADTDDLIAVHRGDMSPAREVIARKRVDRLRTKIALMESNIRALGSRPITVHEHARCEQFVKQYRSSKASLKRWIKELEASGRVV